MTLSSMDYWRLSDELSVIDATILMTGNDPSETLDAHDPTDGSYLRDENGHIRQVQRKDYHGYIPSFRALKNAVLSNLLKATVRHPMRTAQHPHIGEYDTARSDDFDDFAAEHEKQFSYDMLIARIDPDECRPENTVKLLGQTRLNFDLDDLRGQQYLYISKEPDWNETTIKVSDLKAWLEGKGLHPEFFFPNRPTADFKDKSNPRYSPKLAACVEAWEQVKAPKTNKNVKQTVSQWLQSNAASFGVGRDGIVSPTMADELAAVVNWHTSGGATPTAQPDSALEEDEREPVENYQFGYPENSDDDPDIPF